MRGSTCRGCAGPARRHLLALVAFSDEARFLVGLRLYHLRMIEPADRVARYQRYRRLDPDNRLQPIGYDYMLDDSTLELADLEPGREYAPLVVRSAA